MIFSWLVVGPPLWKILVNWDDDIPNIWENKIDVPNHQPVRDLILDIISIDWIDWFVVIFAILPSDVPLGFMVILRLCRRFTRGDRPQIDGFQKWDGSPKWMIYKGKSQSEIRIIILGNIPIKN